jgi:hypothetical protein
MNIFKVADAGKVFCELLFKETEAGCGNGEMLKKKIMKIMLRHDRHPRGLVESMTFNSRRILYAASNFIAIWLFDTSEPGA